MESTTDVFGQVISSYSRAQAIEDGVLVDLSALAQEAGIKFPLAITQRVYELLSVAPDGFGQSFEGRAWDMLTILLYETRRGQGGRRVDFAPLFVMEGKSRRPRAVAMYAMCGPGDNAEPVITVMMPDED